MTAYFDEPLVREPKPGFADLPPSLAEDIGRLLGAAVVGGHAVYGGFSPAAGFCLLLQDGRKVFAKGGHPGDISHAAQNIRQEIAAYQRLPVLKNIGPAFLGSVADGDEDGWILGLWSWIDRGEANPSAAEQFSVLAQAHSETETYFLHDAEEQNYISLFFDGNKKWQRLLEEPVTRQKFFSLFQDQVQIKVWFDVSIETLCAHQSGAPAFSGSGLVHGDAHQENFIRSAEGKVWLVDWPNACRGPAVFDALFLAADIESRAGLLIEEGLRLYGAARGRILSDDEQTWMAVQMAGFWADQAYRTVPDKLPRLRWIQKSMLLALLKFLARRGVTESIPRMKNQRL